MKTILCLLLATASLAAAEPILITAPADPPTIETWTFEEQWSIEGDDPDAPLMGVINDSSVDADGNVLLMDMQLSQVLVISPDGELVRTLGRSGEGPGEATNPMGMVVFDDGSVGLRPLGPAKVVRVAADGTPLPSILPDRSYELWWNVESRAGVTVVSGQYNDYSQPAKDRPSTHFIASLDAEGRHAHVYAENVVVTNWEHPVHDEAERYFPSNTWCLLSDGTMVIARDRDLYRLEFVAPDGEVVRVVERPFEPHARSDEDLEGLAAGVTYTSGGRQLEVETRFLPTDPAIFSMTAMGDDTILVTSCKAYRDLPDGVLRRLDAFGPDGEFRGEILVAHEIEQGKDSFRILPDGRALAVRNATSASRSFWANRSSTIEEEEDDGSDDVMLDVVCLTPIR